MSRSVLRGAAVLGAAGLVAATLAAVTPAGAAPVGTAANCPNGYVGLTYDDGPNAGNTNTLLNALRNNGLRATMFNVGQNAAANPSLVAAQVSAGMWVGNHSYTHPHMLNLSSSQMSSELSRTQSAIQNGGGGTPKIFRPPYGETNGTLQSVASGLGLRTVTWDVDSQDWNGASTAQIVQAAGRLTNGQLILMHDQYSTTVAAVPQIAADLRNRGLCPGTISPSTGRAVAPDGDTTPPPSDPPTTPPPSTGGCSATVSLNAWNGGFVATVRVTAGSAGTNAWTVGLTLPSGATITNVWNATRSATTGSVQFGNVSFNGRIPAGGTVEYGFQATGPSGTMTPSCTAT